MPDVPKAKLACAPNFRQLGGQRTADGRTVCAGLVYRSDALLAPDEADAALVSATGIRLVCDLRSSEERARAPNGWWRTHPVVLMEFDLLRHTAGGDGPWRLLRDDPSAANAREMMRLLYAGFPTAAESALGALFARLAAGAVPALIHCTAGKDRTGFVCAILLASLGVARDEIMADYLASRGRRSARVDAATGKLLLARTGHVLTEAALRPIMDVDEAYLDASFATIEHTYGGMRGYRAAAGISDATVDALREELLQ